MVGHGGSSASSYLADATSPIPSHYASIVTTSTYYLLINYEPIVFLFDYPSSRASFIGTIHSNVYNIYNCKSH